MMTLEQFLMAVGDQRTHKWYKRVTGLRSLYRKLITGEDMDSLMQQFNQRETRQMFEQRKRITKHITKTVAKGLIKPQYKVPRSNGVIRILEYTKDSKESNKRQLEGILGKFWGTKSLDKWMGSRWIELNDIDPNAFVVVEWKPFDARIEKAAPYPFEVTSEQAVLFEYDNNILQYLVVLQVKDTLRRYTLYDKDKATVLQQIRDDKIIGAVRKEMELTVIDGRKYYRVNHYDVYELIEPKPYNLGFVPAMRVGYVRDLYTDGETCVSPIDDAMPILEKLVKANSELDLTIALHTFPQKFEYAPRCQEPDCNNGSLPNGDVCSTCKGTGYMAHTTAQDSVTLALPRSKEEMLNLQDLVHYQTPPVDLVRFQAEYIDSLMEKCKKAIYNSEIFSRQEVAETATGKNIDLQNVYDALYALSEGFSEGWKFFVHAVSKITDTDKNLVYDYIFPKDFKMKSLTELYLDLKTVSDSKADPFVKGHIYDDIAMIIFQDNSRELDRYMVRRAFSPFGGKSSEEIMYIVGTDLTTTFNKVFWANESVIYDELERELAEKGEDFYALDRSTQWQYVSEKVEQYIQLSWTGESTLTEELNR